LSSLSLTSQRLLFLRLQQKLQLNHLKKDLKDEVAYNEAQIKRFQEAIDRHKKRIGEISAEEKNLEKK